MRKREEFSVISGSGIDYLVNTVTRLKNTREFGLGCTESEMLPSQDIEVEMSRYVLDSQAGNKYLLIVKCAPDVNSSNSSKLRRKVYTIDSQLGVI